MPCNILFLGQNRFLLTIHTMLFIDIQALVHYALWISWTREFIQNQVVPIVKDVKRFVNLMRMSGWEKLRIAHWMYSTDSSYIEHKWAEGIYSMVLMDHILHLQWVYQDSWQNETGSGKIVLWEIGNEKVLVPLKSGQPRDLKHCKMTEMTENKQKAQSGNVETGRPT